MWISARARRNDEVDEGTTSDGGSVAVICMSMIIGIRGLSDFIPIFALTSIGIPEGYGTSGDGKR